MFSNRLTFGVLAVACGRCRRLSRIPPERGAYAGRRSARDCTSPRAGGNDARPSGSETEAVVGETAASRSAPSARPSTYGFRGTTTSTASVGTSRDAPKRRATLHGAQRSAGTQLVRIRPRPARGPQPRRRRVPYRIRQQARLITARQQPQRTIALRSNRRAHRNRRRRYSTSSSCRRTPSSVFKRKPESRARPRGLKIGWRPKSLAT